MSELLPAVAFERLKEGEVIPVQVGRWQLAVYLVGGQPYCTEDICSHEECLISDAGFVEGEEVECGCHGARFNVKTGDVAMPPAIDPLRTFPAEVHDGQVYVQIP